MNRSARRMFGGELADFVGEPISIVATPEADHPLRRTDYLQHLADGQAETFECRLKAATGASSGWSATPSSPGRGLRAPGARQLTFALLDIERRRQAEVSIAQAQASLQRIIETAPLAIALFDARSAAVLQLNQMAAMFFGRPLEACWAAARGVAAAPTRRWRCGRPAGRRAAAADACAASARPVHEWRRARRRGDARVGRAHRAAGPAGRPAARRRSCCWWPAT
jgi:PAS domain-containing protein